MSYNSLFGLGSHSPDPSLAVSLDLQQDISGGSVVNNGFAPNWTTVGSPAFNASGGPNSWLPGYSHFAAGVLAEGDQSSVATPEDVWTIAAWLRPQRSSRSDMFSLWDTTGRRTMIAFSVNTANNIQIYPQNFKEDVGGFGNWHFCAMSNRWNVDARVVVDGRSETIAADSGEGLAGPPTLGRSGDWDAVCDAAWAAYFTRGLSDAELVEVQNGPEPINTALPTLTMGSTSWSGTVGTWDSQNNGTVSYAWELRLVEDDSVVESGGGEFPSGSGTYNNANGYYLAVDATNDGGTDLEARSRVGTLGNGLVGWYDASIDDTATDLSGSGNDGTLALGAIAVADTDGPGVGVQAWHLTATDNNGHLNTNIDTTVWHPDTDGFTWSFWLKPETVSSARYWVSNSDGNTAYYIRNQNSALTRLNLLGSSALDVTDGLVVDQWAHVVARANSTTAEVLIDGVSVGTIAYTKGSYPTPQTLIMGRVTGNNGERGHYDSIRIYSRPLSDAEIAEVYEGGRAYDHRDLPEGLGDEVAWYCPSIDDSPDDLSGNGNDGTYNGGMGTVADTNAGGQRAYELDGVDDSINLTGSNFLSGLGSVSLSTWAYIDNFSDTNIIYHESTDSAASLSRLAFLVRTDGQLRVGGRIDDGNSFTVFANSANSAVSLGSWHHLAAVCDFVSGTHRVYLDGIDITDSSSSTTGAFDANLPDAIKVGTNNANYFVGRIDDFRIYGRAISEIEITHLATQRGVLGPPDGIDLDYLWSPTQGDETSLGPIANIGTAGTQDLVTSNVTGNMAWVSDTDKDGLYAIDMEDRDSYRGDPFSTAYSAVTLGCWVKCLDADESGYILSLGSNTSSLWLAAEFRTGGNIRIWSNGVPTQVSDGGITKTDWNHIAVQYDGTNAKLFVNGTEVAAATSAAPSTYNEAVFGTGGTSVFGVEGRIDGMFLEYSELTDPEIAELAVDRTYPTNIDPTEGWHNPFRNSFFYNPFFDNEAL